MKEPSLEELISSGFYVTNSFACLFGITSHMHRYFGNDNKKLELTLYSGKFFIITCNRNNYQFIRYSLEKNGAKDIVVEDIEMIVGMQGFKNDENTINKFHIKFNPENGLEILNNLFNDLAK